MKYRKKTLVRLFVLIINLLNGFGVFSQQIFPERNDSINFSYPVIEHEDIYGANFYRFKIFKDTVPVIDTIIDKTYLTLPRALDYGSTYSWTFFALKGNKTIYHSEKYLFHTYSYRSTFEIVNRSQSNLVFPDSSGVLFIDGCSAAINRKQEVVWFSRTNAETKSFRDINLNSSGKISYLNSNKATEASLNQQQIDILPDFSNKQYHHEILVTSRNHLFTCGFAPGKEETQVLSSTALPSVSEAGKREAKLSSPTILEFNAKRELVWSFNLLTEIKLQLGIDLEKVLGAKRVGHLNGLAYDEEQQIVYASFKNFSNIFKIDKKNNRILFIFGSKAFNPADSIVSGPFFASQHSPILCKNGNLMVYNNNLPGKVSQIVELKNNMLTSSDSEQLVWSYSFYEHDSSSFQTLHMGSMQEVALDTFIISAGKFNQRIFCINKQKQLLWDVELVSVPEKNPVSSYRVSYAKTLFPSNFILKCNEIGYLPDGIVASVYVYNIGTENDSYECELLDTKGKKVLTNSLDVWAGGAQNFVLRIDAQNPRQQLYTVRVTSRQSGKTKLLKLYRTPVKK